MRDLSEYDVHTSSQFLLRDQPKNYHVLSTYTGTQVQELEL